MPLNQEGRWQTQTVVATAGNLGTRKLRAKRVEGGGSASEEEIPADEFQAHAEYRQEWLNFFAELALRAARK